jgi:hypothetical protein
MSTRVSNTFKFSPTDALSLSFFPTPPLHPLVQRRFKSCLQFELSNKRKKYKECFRGNKACGHFKLFFKAEGREGVRNAPNHMQGKVSAQRSIEE